MKGNEIKRANLVLEQDRLGVSNGCKILIEKEITDLLNEFFTVSNVDMKIENDENGFLLLIKVKGDSFKGFHTIN